MWVVAVYDSHIKEKPKDVFVVLPELQLNMVIAPQLIILIHTSNVFIVQGNGLRTIHWCSSAILFLPQYLHIHCGISIGSCH